MASKNKTQLTEELLALGVQEEELKGKTNAELQDMINNIKTNNKATEEPVEGIKNEKGAKVLAGKKVDEKPVLEYEMQMGVHEPKVIKLHPLAKRVVLTNISEGEVLATDSPIGKFEEGDKIAPGEVREFNDVQAVIVRSASRPVIRVSQFIK